MAPSSTPCLARARRVFTSVRPMASLMILSLLGVREAVVSDCTGVAALSFMLSSSRGGRLHHVVHAFSHESLLTLGLRLRQPARRAAAAFPQPSNRCLRKTLQRRTLSLRACNQADRRVPTHP